VKLLLTSSGISNVSIRDALVSLLGKPLSESRALVVPTAIYPFSVGPQMAGRLIRGEVTTPLTDLGWASVGVLELTALPSIKQEVWASTVRAADALLLWGGDPLYLSHWMRESGLADLLPSLDDTVYVSTSADAMVAASVFGETYTEPRAGGRPVNPTRRRRAGSRPASTRRGWPRGWPSRTSRSSAWRAGARSGPAVARPSVPS
jgi:dipeptidase E